MHQTRKGNPWSSGMKMHIGVDDTSGVIHSMETTPANAHGMAQTGNLPHNNPVQSPVVPTNLPKCPCRASGKNVDVYFSSHPNRVANPARARLCEESKKWH